MADYVAAVDVGTGSARAGIFDLSGRMLARNEQPLEVSRPCLDHAEQDSAQIWDSVCAAVGAARSAAGVNAERVRAMAFDATCSLVVRSAEGRQLSISSSGDPRWDTMLWQDQRARAEAVALTATGHAIVARDGGAASPEMQIPKLMWLKRHLPATWARAGLMFDLADYLAWRACGATSRSACTLGCKWSYQIGASEPWPADFLTATGLTDLVVRCGLWGPPVPPATPLGSLLPEAADRLGLHRGCRIAAGLIDAHAGALGCLAPLVEQRRIAAGNLALIAGTSNCVMTIGLETASRPGLWGPYPDAILPGLWVQEGGQTASGGLLDHLCRVWGGEAATGRAFHARVCARITELRAAQGWGLAGELHVLPDFAGNRSPFADPRAGGVISGLALDGSFDGLCRLYWRTAVGLALGVRQIIGHLTGDPEARPDLHLAGGHARSPLLTELYAAATGCRVFADAESDAVLLGTAMVAAAGAGLHADLFAAAAAMGQPAAEHPPDPAAHHQLDRDYRVFHALQRHRSELSRLR